jgi:hypothetical protein
VLGIMHEEATMRLFSGVAAPMLVLLGSFATACGSSDAAPSSTISMETGGASGAGGGATGTGGESMGSGGAATGTGGAASGTGGAPIGPDAGGAGAPVGDAKIDVPPGDPITATPLQWTAVPVTGALCRDGNETGFGVNVNTTSDKLLIYLEGGGACFNGATCLSNPQSWAPTESALSRSVDKYALLSRTGNSPFKDWNLVFVPYCTGDVFTGATMTGYQGKPQMGYSNYVKYLQRIIATFKGQSQVVLSGSSAGGFGIAFNWLVTQDAFGSVPVHALDDSGPPMGPEYLSECEQARVAALWGWSDTVHPACTSCDVKAGNVVRPLLETALRRQTTRFAQLSYDEDGVIKSFFAYGLNDCASWDSLLPPAFPAGKYPMGLAELRQGWMSGGLAAMYEVKGGGHTFLGGDLSRIQTGSVTMLDWVQAFVDGSSGWTHVVP